LNFYHVSSEFSSFFKLRGKIILALSTLNRSDWIVNFVPRPVLFKIHWGIVKSRPRVLITTIFDYWLFYCHYPWLSIIVILSYFVPISGKYIYGINILVLYSGFIYYYITFIEITLLLDYDLSSRPKSDRTSFLPNITTYFWWPRSFWPIGVNHSKFSVNYQFLIELLTTANHSKFSVNFQFLTELLITVSFQFLTVVTYTFRRFWAVRQPLSWEISYNLFWDIQCSRWIFRVQVHSFNQV